MAYWQPLRGIQDPISIRQFGGVYKPDDPGFNLSDSLFTELVNFCPDAFPALTTRPGYTVIGSFGGPVLGLGAWKDNQLALIAGDGTWRRYNGSTWDTLASGLSTTNQASFVNYQGNLSAISLIMANGAQVKYYDGSTVQDLANAPAGGNFIEQHDNRVFLATQNIVNFSALRKPTDWSTVNDAGQIVIESGDGEYITALKSGPKHLIVFKPNSMYDLLGTGPGDFTLIPIAADIGAVNNNCVVNLGGVVFFLHTTGVYTYESARPNKDFCRPIMQYIKRINLNALSACSVGADGLNLYVSLPLDSSTVPNIILQYNLERDAWYTWDGFAATDFLYTPGKLFIGTNDGSVRRVTGSQDNGSNITATAVSKPFTWNSIAQLQQWFKLYAVATLTAGSSLSIYLSGSATGDSDWFLARTITGEGIQYQKIHIPTNGIARKNCVRMKLVTVGDVQVHELTRQIRILPMR